jgi:hypothetical protein
VRICTKNLPESPRPSAHGHENCRLSPYGANVVLKLDMADHHHGLPAYHACSASHKGEDADASTLPNIAVPGRCLHLMLTLEERGVPWLMIQRLAMHRLL